MEPFDTLREEWDMIAKAPWSFAIITLAIAAILYGVLHWEYHAHSEHWKGGAEQKAPAEIAKSPTVQPQTVNAPNGIGTIGGTLVNPEVNNNFGPPPAKLTCSQQVLSRHGDKKIIALHISTDRIIKAPQIAFQLTVPFNETAKYWSAHPPVVNGYPARAYNWGEMTKEHAPVPNGFGILLAMPAVLNPGEDLVLTIEADIHSRVLAVAEVGNPGALCP